MKKSLLSLGLVFIFSFVMLLGTTYAYWSETIVVDENIIQMGNLDLKAELADPAEWDGSTEVWYDLQQYTTTGIFETTKTIYPGAQDSRLVKLTNTGSIPLKYRVITEVNNENPLLPFINFSINGAGNVPMGDYTFQWVTLQPGQSQTFTVSYHVLETLGDTDGSFGEGLTLPFTFTIDVQQVNKN